MAGPKRVTPLASLLAPAAPRDEVADVDTEVAKAVKTLRSSMVLRALRQPEAAPAGAPPPSTAAELVNMTQQMATVMKNTVDLQRDAAEQERQRRREAEERNSSAYAAGEQDAREKYEFFAELQAESHKTLLEVLKAQHEAQLAAMEKGYQAQLTALEKSLRDEIAKIREDVVRTQAERDAAVARVQADAARDKAVLEAQHQAELLKLQHAHEIERLKAGGGPDPLAAAQAEYYKAYYASAGRLAAAQVDDQWDELQHKKVVRQKTGELLDTLKERAGQFVDLFARGIQYGAAAGAQGLPRNGLPAAPPGPPGGPSA